MLRIEKTIQNAFNRAYKKFPHRIKKPNVLVMGKVQFIEYLNNSPLTINPDTTPAVIAHLPERDTIIFCPETIEDMKQFAGIKRLCDFIEALTLHELYHEWNRHRIESKLQALESEMQVDIEMQNDFPKLYRLLENVTKKLINKGRGIKNKKGAK